MTGFDFKTWNMINKPENIEQTKPGGFLHEVYETLKEGYRLWLTTRKIDASVDIDATTAEGKAFLKSIEETISFIRDKVPAIPEDPDRPQGSRYRSVRVKTLFDTIEIRIVSEPRWKGKY